MKMPTKVSSKMRQPCSNKSFRLNPLMRNSDINVKLDPIVQSEIEKRIDLLIFMSELFRLAKDTNKRRL